MSEIRPEYRVFWSDEDQAYVATCALYPRLANIDLDPVEALEGLRQLIADIKRSADRRLKQVAEEVGIMDNLVSRLRHWAGIEAAESPGGALPEQMLYWEAADEIERLRAALKACGSKECVEAYRQSLERTAGKEHE